MKLFITFAILLSLCIISSCGANKSSTSSSGSTFSGTISAASSSNTLGDPRLNPRDLPVGPKSLTQNINGVRRPSTNIAGKTIDCRKPDQTSTTATIGANGEFSVAITAGSALKCNILDGTTDLGTFVVSSSTDKDMKGQGKVEDQFIPAGSIAAGTVSFDPYSAKVTMTDTALGSSVAAATIDDPWDFTGTYLATSYTGTTPTGYISTLCTTQQQQQQGNNCDGPADGETFYIKKIPGFAVDANGNTTTTARYGIMVWRSSTAFASCGSTLGFTYADGKANAKVDLTNSGVAEGAPTWTTAVTVATAIKGWDNSTDILPAGAATVSDGWKISTAKSAYAIQDCETVQVGTGASALPGWKCTDTGNKISISLGGGCLEDVSGNPINVTNWNGFNCQQSNVTITGESNTYIKYTCTGTFNSLAVTCTNTNYQESGFNWNNVSSLAASGASCSTINTATEKGALAKLRCYSEAYWRYMDNLRNSASASSTCFRDLRTDWSATTAANFIISTGPAKPINQYILEGFDYKTNTSGSFRNEEQDIRGIQVTAQSSTIWVNCRTLKVFTMALKRTSTSPDILLAEMVNETRLTDTKASCWTSDARTQLGNLDSDGKAVSKTLFTMTKQ